MLTLIFYGVIIFMRKVKANYTAEFKTKVVLELLKEDQTINEISSKYNVIGVTHWQVIKVLFW